MTIFLCGFMGCGKSALGRALSAKLQLPLTDTDDEIVKQLHMTIPAIFAQKGEPFFRQTETEIITQLAQQDGIVSCGGGVMVNPVNAARAKAHGGIVIYLQQTFAVCYDRIKNDTNRPIVQQNTKEALQQLFQNREQQYQANATYSVIAGETPEESAERVIQLLQQQGELPAILTDEKE
jgi:shikimate kinase